MYVLLNIEVSSGNHCCIKYYECVCVCILAVVIRHANRIFYVLCYIVICDMSGSTILSDIIS